MNNGWHNQIINHDVTKKFPLDDSCIDVCITSPPYWGLRDYGVDGQIGLESHPSEYIERLVGVAREIRRVLKKSGSFYLNLGDTYCANRSYQVKDTANKGCEQQPSRGMHVKFDSGWLQPKQLMGMPWRVAISLQEDGWVLRNCIIWHKPNPMPSSAKDRLANTYEFLFFFVKKPRGYYYDLDAIREPHKELSLLREKYGFDQIPRAWESGAIPISGGKTVNIQNNPAGKNPGDVLEYDSKYKDEVHGQTLQGFARNKTMEQARQQSRVDAKVLFPNNKKAQQEYINIVHDHDGTLSGKNPGDYMDICTQAFTAYNPDLEHFAVFPEELVIKPLMASCPKEICMKCGKPRLRLTKTSYKKRWNRKPSEKQGNDGKAIDGFVHPNYGDFEGLKQVDTIGWSDCGCNAVFKPGVVLDPFCGRGTVGKVARDLGLNYILFDIKPEYCELARLYVNGQKRKLIKYQQKLEYDET